MPDAAHLVISNETKQILVDLQQCRRELDFIQVPQPANWSAVEAWNEKWRLLISQIFPDQTKRFDQLVTSPSWSRPQNSLYRIAEDPSRFLEQSKNGQKEEILVGAFLGTIAEQNNNIRLFNEGIGRLRNFVDGLIAFITKYGALNAISRTHQRASHSNPGEYLSFDSATIRKLLKEVLLSDSVFEAFCLDYFPQVRQTFTAGMDRVAKTNLLLTEVELKVIYNKLRADHGAKIDDILSRYSASQD